MGGGALIVLFVDFLVLVLVGRLAGFVGCMYVMVGACRFFP